MKVGVIGSNGQLGTDCVASLRNEGVDVVGFTHSDVDVVDVATVSEALGQGLDAVVNTAAMHNVAACEADPTKAFAVNAIGTKNLADVAATCGVRLLHISTDYVFGGDKRTPYAESDLPRPVNTYGTSKLAGEYFVLAANPTNVVIRCSGLYGHAPCRAKGGLNFVELMLKLAAERGEVSVVTDEIVSPTNTRDLARQLTKLLADDGGGIIHASAATSCSWYEFAEAIFEISGVSATLRPASAADFPSSVRRPKYSVLENRELKRRGLSMLGWRAGLEEYFESRTA